MGSRSHHPPARSIHGRMIFRTGAAGVAASAGSINLRRRRCRIAACTVDLDKPVFVAIVCRLIGIASRRLFAACRHRNR